MSDHSAYKHFRCQSCGFSGAITVEEIAKHRERCAYGTTGPIPDRWREDFPYEMGRITDILDAKDAQLTEWLKENGPGGWIDDLRKKVAAKDVVIAVLVDKAIAAIETIKELPGPMPTRVAKEIRHIGIEEAQRSLVRLVKREAIDKVRAALATQVQDAPEKGER